MTRCGCYRIGVASIGLGAELRRCVSAEAGIDLGVRTLREAAIACSLRVWGGTVCG